jgi:GTP-binding protein EngB required for normal cell division
MNEAEVLTEARNGYRIRSREILKEIQSACEDFRLDSLKKTLPRVKNFAEQNQYLDIAVLGQFKAGKSSFLNGFVNKPLLPVGNVPVTSVITRMRFGPEEKAAVTFLDGRRMEVPISDIPDYVSESENPENKKNVRLVDIEVPFLNKLKELRLVDTPGIGSIWKHNTETSTAWFPETGGALFVLSADRPISENELSLLKEIYSYTPEIAVVITKVDLYKEEQIKEIEAFTAQALKAAFDRDFPILRYSAYSNPEEYNKKVEQTVFLPIAQNREKTYREILRHKISSLANQCLSYLNISYQASLKKESEKNKLRETILDEHLNAHFIRRELLLVLGSYKEKTREGIKAYLDSFREDIEKSIAQEYETAFAGWKGNLNRVTRQYEEWLRRMLDLKLKEILLKEEKTYELLSIVKKHLAFYLKSFRERLSENLDRVLGVQMKSEEWVITIGEIKKPDISIGRTFDFHLDTLWFLFPMFLFRNVFRRFFFGQIPYEIDKNLYRLTSDMNEKVNKEMDRLMKQALSYMNEELKTIEMLLSDNKTEGSHILNRMNDIKQKIHSL